MDRRRFLWAGALGAVMAPPVAPAQQTPRMYRLGVLSLGLTQLRYERFGARFRQAFAELGWIEGRTFVFENRFADTEPARLAALALELARTRPDAILAIGPPAAMAAKEATSTVPVVFAGAIDPVRVGLVQSLARPGGNVTGVAFASGPELSAEELELLKEIAPRVGHVAFLFNATVPAGELYAAAIEAAGRRIGIEVRRFGIRGADDVESTLQRVLAWPADGFVIVGDALTVANRRRIIEFAARNKLPAAYGQRQFVEDGGLVGYSWHEAEMIQRVASLIDRVFRGAKPADLPVEQPTKYELVVNAKSAAALGLRIPRALLLRADEVIR